MTKITIIGNPGKQPIEILKAWIEKYLAMLNLQKSELWLMFVGNSREMDALLKKYTDAINFPSDKRQFSAKIMFAELQSTCYFDKDQRQSKVPPLIAIKRSCVVSEMVLLDELAHLKEDEQGWLRIKREANKLLVQDHAQFFDNPEWAIFLLWLINIFNDFFSSEMMHQCNLIDELIKERKEKIDYSIRKYLSMKKFAKIDRLTFSTALAFWTAFPINLSEKEEIKELERKIFACIQQISMETEYQKIQSVVSQLKIPPTLNNIYNCGAKIIELAQDFLEK